MGVSIKNPIVVAASTFSSNLDRVKEIEEKGAGALVIRSIFEEQILHEINVMEENLIPGEALSHEASTYLPSLEHAGAKAHLLQVEEIRKAVKMPLIGSVNAVSSGSWVDYTKQLAETGVDAIELNFYAVEVDLKRPAQLVEQKLFDTFEAIHKTVNLPMAVKLSPFYSAVGNVVAELERRGADGVVLFNRFFQPDINIETEVLERRITWSRSVDALLPLRWIALLYGWVKLDLIANSGVDKPADVVKFLLAGATAVQTATALYKHGVSYIETLLAGLEEWMESKGYSNIDAFRGKISQSDVQYNRYNYERAQYVDLILSQE